MEKIVAYDLLEAATASELAEAVNSAIARGWVPSGTIIKGNGSLLQAVVKFE